jgi:hypothetical protein
MRRKKLNANEALKILQCKFNNEINEIYKILGNFREGVHSFETYTHQTSLNMPNDPTISAKS